jgi:hypothetical protein
VPAPRQNAPMPPPEKLGRWVLIIMVIAAIIQVAVISFG